MGKRVNERAPLAPGELEFMSLLWDHGQLTLAEAHELIQRPLGYTTVQTRLNRLVDKGLVVRSADRPAQYRAAISREDVSSDALRTLRDRVTGGQVVPLVAKLLDDNELTPKELRELRQLLRQAEARMKEDQS